MASVDRVAALSLQHVVDDVPVIESAPSSIVFSIGANPTCHPLRFADAPSFDHPYQEDYAVVSKMESLLVEGQTYVGMALGTMS